MAKLILHVTSPYSRQEIPLLRTPLSIGRHPSNDVVLADAAASRHHAVIEWRGGQFYGSSGRSRLNAGNAKKPKRPRR